MPAHIPAHSSLFINIGTTTEAVARELLNHQDLRFITNDLHVALQLSANPNFSVVIAGGTVRNRDGGVVGQSANDMIAQFRVDIAVIGISGIDEDGTLLDYDYDEVRAAQSDREQRQAGLPGGGPYQVLAPPDGPGRRDHRRLGALHGSAGTPLDPVAARGQRREGVRRGFGVIAERWPPRSFANYTVRKRT